MKKFKLRYIFITLGIIALIVIGIIMRKTFVGKIFIALGIIALIVFVIVMLKIKGKFKLRYIFITLGVTAALFVISNLVRLNIEGLVNKQVAACKGELETTVNSLVDERMADFYSNQNSYTPSDSTSAPDTSGNSTSVPDESGDFTDVSWPEDSSSESTPSAESEKIVATIANSEATNLPYTAPCSLSVYEAYDDAFGNASALESGRYVRINLEANVEVENIKSAASVFNLDTEDFEEFDGFTFKSSKNSNNEYRLTFKIPDNPHGGGYHSYCTNFVAVFEIVTNEGTFYVSCAY